MKKKTYSLVEVPLVGYSLTENPMAFGYKELFLGDFQADLYLSDRAKVRELKSILKRKGNKNILKAIFTGYGKGTGIALAAGGGLSGLLFACAGGACPLWLSTVYSLVPALGALTAVSITVYGTYVIEPLLTLPSLIPLSVTVAKRLGQRKLIKKLGEGIKEDDLFDVDYSPILDEIKRVGLTDKVIKYKMEGDSGTRWKRFKRLFIKEQSLKDLQRELYEGFNDLCDFTEELAGRESGREGMAYRTIHETYEYVRDVYKPKLFRKKRSVIF